VRPYDLEIGALVDGDEIEAFSTRVEALVPST